MAQANRTHINGGFPMYDKIKIYLLGFMAAVLPLIVRVKTVPFKGLSKDQTNISQLVSGIKLNYFHYWKAASSLAWVSSSTRSST